MKIRNYINIALIIIWMFTIFGFSNQNSTESSGLSDKVIIKIAEIIKQRELNKEEKEYYISKYKFIVRKCAHFASYFILGFLIIILLLDLKIPNKKAVLITIITCFLYACTDEFHQSFIPGRGPSFIDCLIDTSGSITSTILVILFTKLINKIHTKKETT